MMIQNGEIPPQDAEKTLTDIQTAMSGGGGGLGPPSGAKKKEAGAKANIYERLIPEFFGKAA